MDSDNIVRSVERAIQMLEYIGSKNWAVTVNEVAAALAVPRATAFRIMKTLEKWGYVYNSNGRGDYVLGTRILRYGHNLGRGDEQMRLRQIAGPYCFELAQSTGQTVQLGVLFEYEVMYVDQTVANRKLMIGMPSEVPFPINLSAGGKVLAAGLPDEKLRDLLANANFPRNTENTFVEPEALWQEIAKVRRQGFAVDNQEFAIGVRCVAAPVRDATGEVVFSLGITGHVADLPDRVIGSLTEEVVAMAHRISTAIKNGR